jgi:DNA-binding NtrC family response regulator
VRVLGVTNRDLGRDVEEGRFRKDLFYRLNTVVISVPPLRERKEDIPVLCEHLLERIARRLEWPVPSLSAEALDLLMRHDFPGNVRELENILEAAVIQAGGRAVEAEHLPAYLRGGAGRQNVSGPLRTADQLRQAKEAATRDLERRFVIQMLKEHRGVVKAAAEAAGMNRSHFHQLLAKLGIEGAEFKGNIS